MPWRGEKSGIALASSQMRWISASRSACSSTSRSAMRGASGQAARSATWSAWMRRNIACACAHRSSRSSARATATSALPPAGDARMRGAVEPRAGIECGDHGAQHVEVGMRQRMRRQGQRVAEPRAVLAQFGERLGMARGGGAEALQRVRAASRAGAGWRCWGSRAARADGGSAPARPCRRSAAPPGASRYCRAAPARTHRAAPRSRHPPPVPPSPRGRWRRNRRRNRARRRSGPSSGRRPGGKACSAMRATVAAASSGVPNSR